MLKLALISWVILAVILLCYRIYVSGCSPEHRLKLALGNTNIGESLVVVCVAIVFVIALASSTWTIIDFILRM